MTDELREMSAQGFIILKMKAEDTEFNTRIHDAFRELAFVECKNDYTLALGKLLEYYQADAKIEFLWQAIMTLENKILELEQQVAEPQVEDGGTF